MRHEERHIPDLTALTPAQAEAILERFITLWRRDGKERPDVVTLYDYMKNGSLRALQKKSLAQYEIIEALIKKAQDGMVEPLNENDLAHLHMARTYIPLASKNDDPLIRNVATYLRTAIFEILPEPELEALLAETGVTPAVEAAPVEDPAPVVETPAPAAKSFVAEEEARRFGPMLPYKEMPDLREIDHKMAQKILHKFHEMCEKNGVTHRWDVPDDYKHEMNPLRDVIEALYSKMSAPPANQATLYQKLHGPYDRFSLSKKNIEKVCNLETPNATDPQIEAATAALREAITESMYGHALVKVHSPRKK